MLARCVDGAVFVGSPRQIVAAMRDAAWLIGTPKSTYKREVLYRVAQLPSTPMQWRAPRNITSPKDFLDALVQAGVLTLTLDA